MGPELCVEPQLSANLLRAKIMALVLFNPSEAREGPVLEVWAAPTNKHIQIPALWVKDFGGNTRKREHFLFLMKVGVENHNRILADHYSSFLSVEFQHDDDGTYDIHAARQFTAAWVKALGRKGCEEVKDTDLC